MTDEEGEREVGVLAKITKNFASFLIVHGMCLGCDRFVPESCTVAVAPCFWKRIVPVSRFGKRRIAVCPGFWVWEADNGVVSPVVDISLRHALTFPSRSDHHRCHSRILP